MTFVDAAIEVLKREGKPLPVKRLAELAVKHNLLSVVGRDPASTMLDRLDDVFERHGGRHPDLVRMSADTFGLKIYPPPGSLPALPAVEAPRNGEAARPGDGAGAGKSRRRRRRGRKGDAPAAAGGEAEADDAAEAGDDEAKADEAAPAETAAEAGAPAATAAGEAGAGGRRRRRRGGRGRRRRGEGVAAGAPGTAATTATGGEDDEELDDDAASADESMGAGVPAEAARDEADAPADEAAPPLPDHLPPEAEAAGTSSDETENASDEEAAAGEAAEAREAGEAEAGEGEEGDEELLDEEGLELEADIDHDSGPVLAPAHGTEELTRSDEDRNVRPEIMGSGREDRHRRHRRDRKGHERGKPARPEGQRGDAHKGEGHAHKADAPHPRDAHKPEHHREAHKPEHHREAHKPEHHRDAHRSEAAHPRDAAPRTEAAPGREPGLVEAVLEVLRGSDGRPMHVRHIVEQAAKRRLVDTRVPPNELVRLTRVALARELRERELDGARPRLRALGAGHFGAIGSRLDPELVTVEGELADRAARLRDATRAALRRRLGRMSPPAFEALARALCDKLGVTGVELIRRGEGVAYYGGQRTSGLATVKTLVAVRPGEAEINRRAVGELRAGLAAKGCDEGLLFGGGRAAPEAVAELKAGPGVTAYDGLALATLLMKHGLGVRRSYMPVDYLDLEFLGELTES